MAEKGLHVPNLAPMQKTTKTKVADQDKGKDPSEKNPPNKNPPKQNPPLEPQVGVVLIDQTQNQAPPKQHTKPS